MLAHELRQKDKKEQMSQTSNKICRVTTTGASRVDDLPNSAISGIMLDALALNRGVRVTRIGPGEYTAETAADVACGYTVYQDYA